ncbi:transcriptional regulator, AraC family [Chthoniobacter flavus Ellin428]|uniref:Transcriptional regulator, AraC family n=2 Tax=Chthoniobacter flavus TaxID=191863 RepID=B4D0H6_9BACT|nr:transcriptional regulator, AraC family [Chthoniobacter flavus Ellin428]TCO91888.1 AraC family transcriptional regulator [Chthoniobacter flavus]
MPHLMPASLPLVETTVDGPRTKRWVLEAGACTELAACRIARVGLDDCATPYARIRLRPAGSFFLEAVEGEGRILLDGRWQRLRAGELSMAPPRGLNAFHAVPGRRWVIAWVRCEEPPWIRPLVGAGSPVRLRAGKGEMSRVIGGLRNEWEGARDPRMVHHWIGLLHGLLQRFAQPWRGQERLWRLWEEVGREPAKPWTLSMLAARVHMSSEHLRRLCLRELGRTPVQQLTYLRIQRAKDLLENSDDKLEAIAPAVGYVSALVFSRAFKRWVGCTPSEYRGGK